MKARLRAKERVRQGLLRIPDADVELAIQRIQHPGGDRAEDVHAVRLTLKRLRGVRLPFDVRGLLAEEYEDAGHWRREELRFRVTKMAEAILFRHSDQLVMLTRRIRDELTASNPRWLGAPTRSR